MLEPPFMTNEPPKPANSFRVTLNLPLAVPRLDQVLLEELRKQTENLTLKNISRSEFKELFKSGKIQIKGQRAHPASSLAQGTTTVDILGFGKKTDFKQKENPLAQKVSSLGRSASAKTG